MTEYELQVIPGTIHFVKEELASKHPDAEILKTKKSFLTFKSELNNVDDFRDLYSVLRIKKENGLIRNLFRREWKVETSPAGINPALAYVLCSAAKIDENDVVYDAFCGAGTIAISAALYFKPKKVLASDILGKAADWTTANAKHAGLSQKEFVCFRSNISQVKLQKGSVTKFVSNLPFGVRVSDHEQNKKIYKILFKKLNDVLITNGVGVFLTQEKKLFEDECRKYSSLSIIKSIEVEQGGLYPTIFVVEKSAQN